MIEVLNSTDRGNLMRLIADVHGAVEPLRALAATEGPLLILGDLINFVDYRTYDGIVAEVCGRDFVEDLGTGTVGTEHQRLDSDALSDRIECSGVRPAPVRFAVRR